MSGDVHVTTWAGLEPLAKRGPLVVIIGIDGAGKSTQAQLLVDRLTAAGQPTALPRNESVATLMMAVRSIAEKRGLDSPYDVLPPEDAQLVTSAIKWHYLLESADDLADEGRFVVMDRYTYCYLAGCVSLDVDGSLLRQLFSVFPRPDLVLYLDIPPAEAQHRITQRGIDEQELELLVNLHDAYWSLPEADTFVVIDGSGDIDTVHDAIWSCVVDAIGPFGHPPG